jgi:anti-sigma-K factor RskA
MDADALHDLTAAYALDALEADDARAYEVHLARCERCRHELAGLSEAATALAYVPEGPAPPPELRERILQQAVRERPNVVPLRPRWFNAVAAVAAVAACAAVGLGIWAAVLSGRLDSRRSALDRQQEVAALLADPASQRISFPNGTLVVGSGGKAALVLRNLDSAGSGRTYEAWVADGGAPRPAGLFDGGDLVAVPLDRPVAPGATVMVTKERNGGTSAPTQQPLITVRSASQS